MSQKKGATHVKKHQQNKKVKYVIELVLANVSEQEFYGKVIATLGLCRFSIQNISNNETIQASAPRSFRASHKKEIINVGDTVLIQPGISKNQYFIIHLYNSNDILQLARQGLLEYNKKNNTIISSKPETIEEETSEPLALEDIWNDL